MQGHRLTLADIKLRVAERVSKTREASGVTAVPTDAGELDQITRGIADAQRMLLSPVNPQTRRFFMWRWLDRTIEVPITATGTGRSPGASPHRYLIEQPIMAVPGGTVAYSVDSGGGAAISQRTYRHLTDLIHSNPNATGFPIYVAFKMVPGRRDQVMEMALFPSPSQDFTVKFLAPCAPDPLADDAQVGEWPMWIDDLVVALAVKCIMDSDREAGSAAQAKAAADAADAMMRAIALDQASSSHVIPAPDEHVSSDGGTRVEITDAATGALLVSGTSW